MDKKGRLQTVSRIYFDEFSNTDIDEKFSLMPSKNRRPRINMGHIYNKNQFKQQLH